MDYWINLPFSKGAESPLKRIRGIFLDFGQKKWQKSKKAKKQKKTKKLKKTRKIAKKSQK